MVKNAAFIRTLHSTQSKRRGSQHQFHLVCIMKPSSVILRSPASGGTTKNLEILRKNQDDRMGSAGWALARWASFR